MIKWTLDTFNGEKKNAVKAQILNNVFRRSFACFTPKRHSKPLDEMFWLSANHEKKP